jgi:hypothetical protein
VWPEGLRQWKIPMTPSGIEPVTFRLVARCLNELRHRMPPNRTVKVKVKGSHNRPGVAQRVPGGLGSQISWHSARKGGEVVSRTHRPPLPPGMFLVLIFIRGWVAPRAMERAEGDMSLKNPVPPPGIDPGTIQLVAQRLNHYTTPGPPAILYIP